MWKKRLVAHCGLFEQLKKCHAVEPFASLCCTIFPSIGNFRWNSCSVWSFYWIINYSNTNEFTFEYSEIACLTKWMWGSKSEFKVSITMIEQPTFTLFAIEYTHSSNRPSNCSKYSNITGYVRHMSFKRKEIISFSIRKRLK